MFPLVTWQGFFSRVLILLGVEEGGPSDGGIGDFLPFLEEE